MILASEAKSTDDTITAMFCYSRFSVFLYEEISIRLVHNHEASFSDGIIFAQWQQMMEQYHV